MKSRNHGGRSCVLVVVLLAGIIVNFGTFAGAAEPFLDSDEIFELTIDAPLMKLMRQSEGAPDVTGHLELADGTSIPMTCNKYGISRLRECRLASLVIHVEEGDVRGTPFEGRKLLRIVTPCQLRKDFDSYTLLEYLIYRSYTLITEPALHVRLAHVRLRESNKPAKDTTSYAFFIEDIGEAARRRGRVWCDIQTQEIIDLDAAQLTLMTLFQYMVGNTDWSAVRGRPNERCCHNVAVLGGGDSTLKDVMPFDFDQSGLVDAPYAVPNPNLKIRRVTQRKYRGLCEHNSLLPDAIAIFNQRRTEITALFDREDLPFPKDRAHALEYIDGFYATINDSKKLEKEIIKACR